MAVLFFLSILLVPASAASANPGDPLYCSPDEGTTFLIVNGTTGVFTTYTNCYSGSNVNNNNVLTTPAHGTLTSDGAGNYVYATSPANYTGLDTFDVHVDHSTTYTIGGPGNLPSGGTITITLNVLPSSLPPVNTGYITAVQIPIPAGSVTPCPGTFGCVTGGRVGSVAPTHGTVTFSGLVATYTPSPGFSGTETFTIRAVGLNNDGAAALNSGDITVQVTVSVPPVVNTPSLSTWGLIGLAGMLMLFGWKASRKYA